jgi:hypothetical protein
MLGFGEINLQLVCLVLRFKTVDGGRTLRLTVDGSCSVVFLFFLNHKGTKKTKAIITFVPLWFKKTLKQKPLFLCPFVPACCRQGSKKTLKQKFIIPLSLCACLLQTGFKKRILKGKNHTFACNYFIINN